MFESMRKKTVDGRTNQEIEKDWTEDNEFYEGLLLRQEEDTTRPPTDGQLSTDDSTYLNQNRDLFLNIVRPYVDASSARLQDMMFHGSEATWDINPTPITHLEEIVRGDIPEAIDGQIRQRMAGMGEGLPEEEVEQEIQNVRGEVIQDAKLLLDESIKNVAKIKRQIEDWLVESHFEAEMMMAIDDCAKLGTGIVKGPVPLRSKKMTYENGKIKIRKHIKPISARVSCFNLFPDEKCGENIHNGECIWERDFMDRSQLRALAGQPSYIKEEIAKVLYMNKEVSKASDDDAKHTTEELNLGASEPNRTNNFTIWTGYCTVDYAELKSCGYGIVDDQEESRLSEEERVLKELDEVHIVVTMVEERIIRLAVNNLESGSFPYDFLIWSKRSNMPWGRGIARLVRAPQRMVLSATHNMLNNAGIAGTPMIIYDQSAISAVDGNPEIKPGKMFQITDDTRYEDVEKAMRIIQIPMLQRELESIILLGLKFAEDVTGMPMIFQGQQGSAPDTVGGMKLLENNATSPMRRIARKIDTGFMEPHIRRYYEYYMLFSEDDQSKVEVDVKASGTSSAMDKQINHQIIMDIGQYAQDPKYGIDPRKWFAQLAKVFDLDSRLYEYDDEEKKSIDEQLLAQSQQPDPTLQIAQMKMEIEKMKLEQKAAIDEKQLQQDLVIEKGRRASAERIQSMVTSVEASLAELEAYKIETEDSREFDKIKAKLAQNMQTLRTQIQLARMNSTQDAADDKAEPPGRAKPGKEFTQ